MDAGFYCLTCEKYGALDALTEHSGGHHVRLTIGGALVRGVTEPARA